MASNKDFQEILRTWYTLSAAILSLSEAECEALYRAELAGQRRRTFLRRIMSRRNRLRLRREFDELEATL